MNPFPAPFPYTRLALIVVGLASALLGIVFLVPAVTPTYSPGVDLLNLAGDPAFSSRSLPAPGDGPAWKLRLGSPDEAGSSASLDAEASEKGSEQQGSSGGPAEAGKLRASGPAEQRHEEELGEAPSPAGAEPQGLVLDEAARAQHRAREEAFTRIYRTNEWSSGESRSGPGSEVGYTANIRRFMGLVFRAYGIRSWLDSPCGDCNWQPHIPGFNATNYTGVDIVQDVVEANRLKYEGHTNMKFFQVDLASDPLPQGPYNLVLCRDMVQHLTLQGGLDAYRDLEKSGAQFLLTSFHSEAGANSEANAGGFRYVDPMLPPFNFSQPIMYALDGADGGMSSSGRMNYKMVGLWRLPALGQGNGQSVVPVNTAAMDSKVTVLNPEAAQLMRDINFSNFVCHREGLC